MRAAVAVLLVLPLLAGCVAPDEEDPKPRVFGACPHWTQRGEPVEAAVELGPGQSLTNRWVPGTAADGPALEQDGLFFDMVRIDVTGTVTGASVALAAVAEADGNGTRGLRVFDYADEKGPRALAVAKIAPTEEAERIFEVFLASVEHGAPPVPAPILLTWTMEGNGTAKLGLRATYFDRVCGVPA